MRKKEHTPTKCDIGEEIVKSFHAQFAENQNHHQGLFLQVLAVLLTVLTGFGYVYIRLGVSKSDINITGETVIVFLSIALSLLSLAMALITNMALGFRRDQLATCNIRVKTGVLNMKEGDDSGYFLQSYNPVGKIGFFDWMPGFYSIFFVTLLMMKAVLALSVFLNPSCKFVSPILSNGLLIFSLTIIFFSFITDIGFYHKNWRKWNQYSDKAPKQLQIKGESHDNGGWLCKLVFRVVHKICEL